MTEGNVAIAMERLLGEHAPHLHDVLTQTVAKRLLTHRPADAVVITLNEIRSRAWGVSREFTTLESVEAYA
jgi:hypothetical protein